MAGPAKILRELHRLYVHSEDLQESLNRLPFQVKAKHNRATFEKNQYETAEEELKRCKVQNHELEVTLATLHQNIEKYTNQRNQITSIKENEALNSEIIHAEKRVVEVEEQIIQSMEEIEERSQTLPEQKKLLEQVTKEAADFEEQSKNREVELTEMIEHNMQQIKETEQQLPPDVQQAFARVYKTLGTDGISPIEGNACKACSIEITPQNRSDLLMDNFVQCNSCGRILYDPSA